MTQFDIDTETSSAVDSTMLSSDTTTVAEGENNQSIGVGALVTSVTETIKIGVTEAIDNVSKLSGNDVVHLAQSISWGIESLAKSTEDMVFPRQAEDKMHKKHIKQVMAYQQQMAHAQYYAAVAIAAQQEEERKKKNWFRRMTNQGSKTKSTEEKKTSSVLTLAHTHDALRRNQSKQKRVDMPDTTKSVPEKKLTMPLKAYNR